MQKKGIDFKLPAIPTKNKDNHNKLSNTISESNCTPKLRPASLNRVEDLEKKLFSKLDSYEDMSKKAINKKAIKQRKLVDVDPHSNRNIQSHLSNQENYDRMQKVMPHLYNKLIQNKKGSHLDLQTAFFQTEPHTFQNIHKFHKTASELKDKEPKSNKVITSNKSIQPKESDEEKNQLNLTEKDMKNIYDQYALEEGFLPETSNQELEDMGKSLINCQSQIQNLKKNMEFLIKQIGLQCVNKYEEDQKMERQNSQQ